MSLTNGRFEKGHQHNEQTLKKISASHTGLLHSKKTKMKISKGNIGKKRTSEQIKRMRLAHLGKRASKETKAKLSKSHLGHKLSILTRQRISIANLGELAPNWKGGISKENHRIRDSLQYRLWREAVFKRDNWACQFCGRRSKIGDNVQLNADHIKPFALFPELRFDINNGRTLCIECHRTTESYCFGKKKSFQLELV